MAPSARYKGRAWAVRKRQGPLLNKGDAIRGLTFLGVSFGKDGWPRIHAKSEKLNMEIPMLYFWPEYVLTELV